jgi:hypothetical protein
MVFNFRIRSFVYYLSIIVLVILVASCESNNYKFYVPKIPFKSGYEELGDPKQANLKYNFELFKYEYIINLSIDNNKYNKAASLPKTALVNEGENLSTKKFYNLFLHDKNDEATLKNIINQIKKRSNGKEFDVVQVIVNFVQSIPYEEARQQKYPIETLFLNKGDCSDKSILLAKLLSLAGYKTCLFVYENAKHMAVGIASKDKSTAYRSGYIYVESTGYNPIGDIPKEFVGGVKINEEPIIVNVNGGEYPVEGFNNLQKMYKSVEIKYGRDYFNTTKKGKIILETISKLDLELKSVKKLLDRKHKEVKVVEKTFIDNNCKGDLETEKYNTCLSIQKSLNQKNIEYNRLVERFNINNNTRNNNIQLLNEINRNNYIKN